LKNGIYDVFAHYIDFVNSEHKKKVTGTDSSFNSRLNECFEASDVA